MDTVEGFVNTHNQEQYDECEAVIIRVVNHIRDIAQQWKVCLIPALIVY